MMFAIDSLNPGQTVKKTLDEIDTLIAFTGRKPEKIALFPNQFYQVKRGCLVALRRKLRAEVKQLSGGGD